MDNLENGGELDPQEAADVTAASGQSDEVIETQQTDVSEPVDGGTEGQESVSEAVHPWDNDERFKGKTPEEMFQIVQEADKYKGELGKKAKVADMLAGQYGLTPERMAEIMEQRELQAKQAEFQKNPTAAVMAELENLKAQMVVKEEEQKLGQFLTENPQYSEFAEEIKRLGFTVDRDKSWNQIAEKYFGRAISKGQEAAYRQMDTKQRTQATGVSRSAPKQGISLDDMRGMSAAELMEIVPKA